MLAIMNVGKYSTAPLPPGGEVIISKLSSQIVGITPNLFKKHGNTIIGIQYDSPSYVVSTDNGETWQTVITTYILGGCEYSNTLNKWYFIEGSVQGEGGNHVTLHYGYSNDGLSITWSDLKSDIVIGKGHTVQISGEHVIFGYDFGNTTYEVVNEELTQVASYSHASANELSKKTQYSMLLIQNYTKIIVNPAGVFNSPQTWYSDYNDAFFTSISSSTQWVSRDGVNATKCPRGTNETLRGYFEIGDYTYVYTDSKIARAGSLLDACALDSSKFTSLSDIGLIKAVLNLTDRKCLLASSGSIYLCEIK